MVAVSASDRPARLIPVSRSNVALRLAMRISRIVSVLRQTVRQMSLAAASGVRTVGRRGPPPPASARDRSTEGTVRTTAPNLVVAGDTGVARKLRETGRFPVVFDVASARELRALSRSGQVAAPAAFMFAPGF